MQPFKPEPELQIVEIPPKPSDVEISDAFWRDEFAKRYDPKKSVEEIGREIRQEIDKTLN